MNLFDQRDINAGYFSPLRIPEGKRGRAEIKHRQEKAGAKLDLVSHRTAIFGGKKAQGVILQTDMIVHCLLEGGNMWMSDCPQEIAGASDAIRECNGRVLIGGLGIGYIATMLDRKKTTTDITVVEKSRDVIALVWKHLKLRKTALVQGDLFTFLRRNKGKQKFDSAFYDIWAPTGERVLDTHIRPLRALSRGIVPQERIYCWEEATMLGQTRFALLSIVQCMTIPSMPTPIHEPNERRFQNYRKMMASQWTFMNWIRKTKPTQEEARAKIDDYVAAYVDEERWAKFWKRYEK